MVSSLSDHNEEAVAIQSSAASEKNDGSAAVAEAVTATKSANTSSIDENYIGASSIENEGEHGEDGDDDSGAATTSAAAAATGIGSATSLVVVGVSSLAASLMALN